jgi:hypothetical protein
MVTKVDFGADRQMDLSDLDAEVGRLIHRADRAKPPLKILYESEIDSLLGKSKQARNALEHLRLAGEDTWKSKAAQVDKALQDFEAAVGAAKSRLRSTEAA